MERIAAPHPPQDRACHSSRHTAQAGHEGGSGALHRLENPAPQPPYPLLVFPPVHLIPGVPIENRARARRSVHRSVQLAPWFWHRRCFDSKAHLPTSAPLSGPGTRPGIRPVIRQPSGRSSRCYGPRFPAAFPPPAFASWAPCPARRDSAPIAVGLPHAPRIPAPVRRTLAGLTRSARMRPGPGWALSLPPGTTVFAGHRLIRGRRPPPSIGRSLFTPQPPPNPGCGLVEASATVSW